MSEARHTASLATLRRLCRMLSRSLPGFSSLPSENCGGPPIANRYASHGSWESGCDPSERPGPAPLRRPVLDDDRPVGRRSVRTISNGRAGRGVVSVAHFTPNGLSHSVGEGGVRRTVWRRVGRNGRSERPAAIIRTVGGKLSPTHVAGSRQDGEPRRPGGALVNSTYGLGGGRYRIAFS